MKVKLSRLHIAVALAVTALVLSFSPATSYAAAADYWPPYPVSYGCYHAVYYGETLSGIAWRYGTSSYYLMQLNGIQNPNLIYAGTYMHVPCTSGYPTPYSQPYMYQNPYHYTYHYMNPYPMPYQQPYPQPYPQPNPNPYPYPQPYPPPVMYPTPMYGTPVPMPTPPTSGQVLVVMHNIAFNSAMITIHVGQTVVWRNDDTVPHTTTSGTCPNGVCSPMPGWDSGTLNPGQSFSHQFTATGTFPYYCRIHGVMMQGTIVVMP